MDRTHALQLDGKTLLVSSLRSISHLYHLLNGDTYLANPAQRSLTGEYDAFVGNVSDMLDCSIANGMRLSIHGMDGETVGDEQESCVISLLAASNASKSPTGNNGGTEINAGL